MISNELIVYCLVLGGAALLVVTIAHEWLGKVLKLSRDMPSGLIEPTSPAWYLLNFVMEYLFLVAVPTFAYSIFVVALPLAYTTRRLCTAPLTCPFFWVWQRNVCGDSFGRV